MPSDEARSWIALIKSYIPGADDSFAEQVLLEQTTFPVGDREVIERQILDYADRCKYLHLGRVHDGSRGS